MKDDVLALAIEDGFKLFAGIIAAQERQKWIRACLDFGGEDEGSTAYLIMRQGLE